MPLKSPSTSPVAEGDTPQRALARSAPRELAEAPGTHLPALVAAAGPPAVFAYEEFLVGTLANSYTRAAYARAVERFLAWCEASGLQLPQIAPKDVGRYRDVLLSRFSAASVKLHLAAIRHFFDLLVTRHVVILNPAATVRGPRYQTVEGKTPEITIEQARRLLASVDVSHAVGLRDRAILGALAYTAARVGAIAKLRRRHYIDTGEQRVIRFDEKGGKSREIPVRHDLAQWLDAYLEAAGRAGQGAEAPLFRSAAGKTRRLTDKPMSAGDICRMVKRRLKAAGLPARLSPHSFRVTAATDLLNQDVPLADVQYLLGHADPRTTRIYDRRPKRVTRNLVERISI